MDGNCGRLNHCCWFKGQVCQYLTENPPESEFKYSCGLKNIYGTWEATHASQEYIDNVHPKMVEVGLGDIGCGDWPPPGHHCNTCGDTGV